MAHGLELPGSRRARGRTVMNADIRPLASRTILLKQEAIVYSDYLRRIRFGISIC